MRLTFFCLALGFMMAAPALAQPEAVSSQWSRASHSSVRLIAGGRNPDGAYRVGVEITMASGFKTYWRQPGDSGVPPIFDWSGSENLGSVSVRWPAPKRFVDHGLTTIGYKGHVIFPALIRPAEAGKAVTALLKLDYAVCDAICIPVKAEVMLKLPEANETALTGELNRFRAQAPRAKEPGKLDDLVGLVSAVTRKENGRQMVEVTIATPNGAALQDVFLEGPEGWLFGTPSVVTTEETQRVLRVPVDDKPKNVVGMVPVVLTITGLPESTEVRFDLDMSPTKP
jgi:DsbC/DsbD-like thiol-disulfide interchange protein